MIMLDDMSNTTLHCFSLRYLGVLKGEDYLTCEGHPSLEDGCVIVAIGEPLETLQVHGTVVCV